MKKKFIILAIFIVLIAAGCIIAYVNNSNNKNKKTIDGDYIVLNVDEQTDLLNSEVVNNNNTETIDSEIANNKNTETIDSDYILLNDDYIVLNVDGTNYLLNNELVNNNITEKDDIGEDTDIDKLMEETNIITYNQDLSDKDKIEVQDVQIEYDKEKLSLKKVKINDKYIYYKISNQYIELLESKDLSKYAFSDQDDEALYLIDAQSDKLTKISLDTSDIYSLKELSKIVRNDGAKLHWCARPIINNENSKVAFLTNRRGFDDGEYNVDVWIHDLVSGQEYLLLEDSMPLVWNENGLYCETRSNQLIFFDYKSKEVKVISEKVEYIQLDGSYIIYSDGSTEQTFYFFNINNFNKTKIVSDPNGIISAGFEFSPTQNKVMTLYATDYTDKNTSQFMVIDLVSNQIYYKPIPISSNIPITIAGWYDENNVVFKTYDERNLNKVTNTIIMDLSENLSSDIEHSVEIINMK